MNSRVFLVIILFLSLFSSLFIISGIPVKKEDPHISPKIEVQGFERIPNILEKKEVEQLLRWIRSENYKRAYHFIVNHPLILSRIREKIPDSSQYIFQDYSYFILKSRVHTCHRDNNGTFFNPTQKHPSYTVIFYLEDIGQGLDVIPGSHLSKYPIFVSTPTHPIDVQMGDAILFDANLIHSGSIHPKDSIRIQMKLSHPEDIPVLSFYQDFHKVLNKPNTSSSYALYLQKKISCHFPFFSDVFMEQEDKQNWRGSLESDKIGIFHKTFSYLMYGDSDYYDIPNISSSVE
jgi:hypothetical protein